MVRASTKPGRRSGCPISIALESVGDRWSLLVIRDLKSPPMHERMGGLAFAAMERERRGTAAGSTIGYGAGLRFWTYLQPKRPLMQRLPRVTSWSSGDVTFTISLSWTCNSRLQPTPQ